VTELNNALVLVSGATGGFGRHFVDQLLRAGSRLIVTDLSEEALDALCSGPGVDSGQIAASVAADLSAPDGCRELHAAIDALGIVPDVLINNAGVAVAGRIDRIPGDRWESLMQINLLAPMRLTSLFLPAMLERGCGHIVNISSLAGWVGSPGLSSYCSAKFGLRGFGEALAMDLDELGIRISTVYPAFSDTPIIDSDQFGYDEPRAVPREILTDPADVVARVIDGIRRDRRHIFPDRMSLVTHYLSRYVPFVIPVLQRRLERRSREAAVRG
jgi:short-subunit dehydrogenase